MNFLKTLYSYWMKFAHALGWVNTRIILSIVYFLIFTPLSIIFRLIGKDPMERRFKAAGSYWTKREATEFRQEDYKKQF